MKYVLIVPCACLLALASCTTTENSIYQSVAPEARGERAISSAIELIAEVDIETAWLGVFYSREVFSSGEAQNVLFTVRAKSLSFSKAQGRITDFSLRRTSSLSVEQAERFLAAIEEYLGKALRVREAERDDQLRAVLGHARHERGQRGVPAVR